jgi:glycerol-3-phosphate cytidylyltransferase-like family protein
MGRIPTGVLIWSLKRYTKNDNLWDRVCFRCKQTTPVFEYEHRDEQQRPLFSYLCEHCAQNKLGEWLQCAMSPDAVHLGYQSDFDIATVSYEQKNDGETLTLTRWSPEQRRRRLQADQQ